MSLAGLNRCVPKIWASGWKITVVPRRLFGLAERTGRGPGGCRGRNSCAKKLAVAGDLDAEVVGERVDDRDADAVQAAGGLVGLARETCRRRAACRG